MRPILRQEALQLARHFLWALEWRIYYFEIHHLVKHVLELSHLVVHDEFVCVIAM